MKIPSSQQDKKFCRQLATRCKNFRLEPKFSSLPPSHGKKGNLEFCCYKKKKKIKNTERSTLPVSFTKCYFYKHEAGLLL